jgi:ferric-chelate reductase [NAD(P)H]
MSYGLYIVSSRLGEKFNGQIANAVMQTTAEPVTLVLCLNKQNLTEQHLSETGVFSVSVLEEDVPMTFIGTFGFKSGRDIDKFAGVGHEIGELNVPMVKEWSLSALEAKITGKLDMGTHTLFTSEVVSAVTFKEGVPLTYANYHLIKKGKSPKSAPTFAFNAIK